MAQEANATGEGTFPVPTGQAIVGTCVDITGSPRAAAVSRADCSAKGAKFFSTRIVESKLADRVGAECANMLHG